MTGHVMGVALEWQNKFLMALLLQKRISYWHLITKQLFVTMQKTEQKVQLICKFTTMISLCKSSVFRMTALIIHLSLYLDLRFGKCQYRLHIGKVQCKSTC